MNRAKNGCRFQVSAPVLICLLGLVTLVQGCGVVRARNPVPPAYMDEAQVVGMPDVRGYGDAPDDSMHRSAVESIRQELAAQPGKSAGVFATPTMDILAISGGGADGALERGCCAAGPNTATGPSSSW
jgi:hypothetical protein